MSLSVLKPALIAVAVLAVPVAASAHGTCKPAKAVHKVVHKVAYKPRPKAVKAVRVQAAIPPCCNTRTVVRYVQAPPPPPVVRRVIVYRDRPAPVYAHAAYVDEGLVVESRYAVQRSYVHHEYHRRDVAYDGRWRHYDWRDDRPY